ncbi:NUDIX hydrolase [Brevibacterium sp. RIT 803]|uniref:NUDIX hydrolase n=1 Tax=Brevibacterium sp. RIT 803 TaxID=2810210 RepID=UPI00195059D3|nr:NUDIX hydrolase [Brevibacterium sp. RIT 803]MBM6590006.1 NUDIX hydrolase [Brevibacterium sp. RIT 803]
MIHLDTARAEVRTTSTPTDFAADFERLFSAFGDAALRRGAGAEHVTASCLVFDPDTESVLLNHHRKAGLWGQFGGHLEAEDDSLRSAARREAMEESGLSRLTWFSPAPIDLHVHDLSASFGACERHFDVVFAAVASADQVPVVSDESLAVKWFPLSALPSSLMPDLVVRLPKLYQAGVAAQQVSDRHPG